MENLDQSNNKNVSLSLIAEYGTSDSESDDIESPSIENMTNDESEDGAELSDMVLKNNIINACAHGPLSGSSGSSERDTVETTRHMIIDNSDSGVLEYEVTEYRDIDSDSDSSSSSDSSDSDVDSVKDVEELSSSDENDIGVKADKAEAPKVHGELGLDDLPPIEDLAISLPAQETTKIGTIASIVDRLVIVQAFPETPALDLDSVLFLENGARTLGRVFDVFGPVTEPHYCIRFNSSDHMKVRGVEPGMDVFIAPKSQHTSYVFLNELMRTKGSDASWLHDIEPPVHQVEYSDDEEERKARQQRKQQHKDKESDQSEEPSERTKKPPERRNQRPSESSSRFGSGPSRGRNPFSAGSRRNNPNAFPSYYGGRNTRPPPPHPNDSNSSQNFNSQMGFPANGPPMFPPPFNTNPPPFNPNTPPPFMGNSFQFGGHPRMVGPPMPMGNVPPQFRRNGPVFGNDFCTVMGPRPQWLNGPPPPPGT